MDIERSYLAGLRELAYHSAAKERARKKGLALSRKLFTDGDTIVKVWPRASAIWNSVFVAGKIARYHDAGLLRNRPELPVFATGLVDKSICPAFVDHLYEDGVLVGYATKLGTPLTDNDLTSGDVRDFLERFITRTANSGYVFRDLHIGNLIRLGDGRISLIDLETPIAKLDGLDLDEEIQSGALRRGIIRPYRRYILRSFDRRTPNDAEEIGQLFEQGYRAQPPAEEFEPAMKETIQRWMARTEEVLKSISGTQKVRSSVSGQSNRSLDIEEWMTEKRLELDSIRR